MNVLDFDKYKKEAKKISMVTCYDYSSAKIIAESQIDCVLVGDSVSMVVHGYPSTVYATVDMMALHTAAVARGLGEKFLIADMPFLSFRRGADVALRAVDKLMKAGAAAVKLEGVWGHEAIVEAIVGSGVPVMGHLGLTPQSVNQLGGFKVQGRHEKAAKDLLDQAKKLEALGCFSLVLECVPAGLAKSISQSLTMATIGIGAGSQVDGQVLVLPDMLGLSGDFKPKFLKKFLNGKEQVLSALNQFHSEVLTQQFPSLSESYT